MDVVSEVKARLNIEDVVSEYVQLKRAGQNYKGLSPFTSEKTPSFVVSPQKQIWHDFSSGRGGDVFTFIQEVEGLDFKGSLELLARKAGVDLDQFKDTKQRKGGVNKERLYTLLEQAAKFYQVQLKANKSAWEYIAHKRGFTKPTILSFQLGYSPDSGDALVTFLQKRGYSLSEMKAAGVTAQRGGRSADMFRGRIMVPLHDQFGKVVGFTARLLHDVDGAPKYINTPATTLYDKSRHIYGLHLAKKRIQQEKFSVLVEGNLDVISSHQAGVANVVATAGTALTQMQLKVLGRFSPDVRLAFDEDRAGVAATERAIPIAAKTGVELSIITIPSGKDPDELIRANPDDWKQAIKAHQYALDWLIAIYAKQLDLSSAVGKRQLSQAVLPVVKQLENAVEQDHYIQKVAVLLGITAESVRAQMEGKNSTSTKRLRTVKPSSAEMDARVLERIKTGDRLLSIAFSLRTMRGYLDGLQADMFSSKDGQYLFTFLQTNPDFSGKSDETEALQQIRNYVKIITLQFEELYVGIDELELQYEATRLRTRLVELFVKDQKKQIVLQMETAPEAEQTPYLQKVRELDQLLKRTKE